MPSRKQPPHPKTPSDWFQIEFEASQLSESSYAIETKETPTQVYNRFKKYLDGDDALYVITLSSPWYGQGPKAVVDWLTARLG